MKIERIPDIKQAADIMAQATEGMKAITARKIAQIGTINFEPKPIVKANSGEPMGEAIKAEKAWYESRS